MSLSLVAAFISVALGPVEGDSSREREATPFVRALWLVQHYGTAEAVNPRNDIRTKAALAKALGKEGVLTAEGVKGLMGAETFNKLAGEDGKLDANEMRRALDDMPVSRKRLFPKITSHLDYLATSFDLIDEPHREAGEALARWIAAHYRPGKSLGVVIVCTGNSRRSILGATMGNVAAAYCGMTEVRFYSGGTAPTAFNPRTVASLKEVGVEIEPTGKEAKRGEPKTPNPVYRLTWGEAGAAEKSLEAVEYSKLYSDEANPRKDFAALLVCSEADAACPFVRGASVRVSMPYLDPKLFDDSAYEAVKYRERRDDIGRLMLSVLIQARAQLASGKSSGTTSQKAP